MKTKSVDMLVFQLLGYAIVAVAAVLSLLPVLVVLGSSFASGDSLAEAGYRIIPRSFSIDGYRYIFAVPGGILRAYGITTFSMVTGTAASLFFTSMGSYVLWRKDFPWRNGFAFFFYFTTLFSGGLVPWYILYVRYLHIKELPLLAVTLPYLFSVFNLLIIRNFLKSIPDAIVESAKIDGAGDFLIYRKLILPLSKPGIASIGLFVGLAYWNDWFLSYIFISEKSEFIQLQFYLYKMLSSVQVANDIGAAAGLSLGDMPTDTARMAMTVIVIGPIVFLYPLLQPFFIKGLTIGAVKG